MSDIELPEVPALRVVKGDPSPEELAALVAVVSSLGAGGGNGETPTRARSTWADPARRVRRSMNPGPAAWRTSVLP